MSLYTFYRISKPSQERVPDHKTEEVYKALRSRTFWGATSAYSLFYLCRLSMGVVKKPLIDDGVFSATELGVIASAFYFVYAIGKFVNGFMADYCNVRRYMATGLAISSVINLLMGLIGIGQGYAGFPPYAIYLIFVLLWGINGWVLSMGSPSGIVSLSRWFPQSRRGTYYSIFCSTPYIGEALSMAVTGSIVAAFGWEYGFIASAIGGFAGVGIILVPLLKIPQKILQRYMDEANDEHIFTLPTNCWCNRVIKDMAQRANINKRITFHTARHTFATTVTLSYGVPIEAVSRMLGHTDIKTTQIYAKILESVVNSEMQRASDRINIYFQDY